MFMKYISLTIWAVIVSNRIYQLVAMGICRFSSTGSTKHVYIADKINNSDKAYNYFHNFYVHYFIWKTKTVIFCT